MKYSNLLCYVILSITCIVPFAVSNTAVQWQSIGPEGGGIHCLKESNGKLLAGGRYLYESEDSGETWQMVAYGSDLTFGNLAVKGDTFFTVSVRNDSVLWRSTDNGKTWHNIYRSNHADNALDLAHPLVFDAINDVLFFRCEGRFLRSIDGGDSWDTLRGAVADFNPAAMVHFGDTIVAGGNMGSPRLTSSTSATIMRSVDKGKTWERINTEITGRDVATIIADNDVIYAGTQKGLFMSSDRGSTWSHMDNGIDHVLTLKRMGNALLCGRRTGLYYSSDDGEQWNRISIDTLFDDTTGYQENAFSHPSFGAYSGVWDILVTEKEKVFVSTTLTGFLYESNRDLNLWQHRVKGISPRRHIKYIATDSNHLYAIDILGRLYHTSNRGRSWDIAAQVINTEEIGCLYKSNNYFLVSHGVLRSLDNGKIWINFDSGMALQPIYSFTEINDTLFGASRQAVYYLKNGKTQWTAIDTNRGHPIIANRGRLFAGPDLSVSMDHGRSWNDIAPLPSEHKDSCITAFAAYDNLIFAAKKTGEMYVSKDNGNSWRLEKCPENIFIPESFFGRVSESNNLLAATASMVFAGTADSGIYVSFDTARTWFPLSNEWTGKESIIRSLAIQEGKYLYAATFDGIHMIDIESLDPSSVAAYHKPIKLVKTNYSDFSLRYVGKNAIQVTLFLNKSGPVKVTLSDLQGRQLFTGQYQKGGSAEFNISIPVKSAGLHILEIVTPDGNRRVPVVGYR